MNSNPTAIHRESTVSKFVPYFFNLVNLHIFDLFIPLQFTATQFGINPELQSAEDCKFICEQNHNFWFNSLCLTLVGQAAAISQAGILAIARNNVILRESNDAEIHLDLEKYGFKVLGKECDPNNIPQNHGQRHISYLDRAYPYLGPQRIEKSLLNTQLKHITAEPEQSMVDNILNEINESAPNSGTLNFHILFYAKPMGSYQSAIQAQTFRGDKKVVLSDCAHLANIESDPDKQTFFVRTKTKVHDLSASFHQNIEKKAT